MANAACAGSCQGKSDGSCSYAPTSTACVALSCNTSGQSQAAGTCNGTGLCSMPAPVSCRTGGTCSAGVCSCPTSLPNECGSACGHDYWADAAGAIYRCPTNDLDHCKDKRVLLTTGAATSGFFQDSKKLYWGTMETAENPNGKLLRMAK